ncbi:serine/threonine protein kinase [Dactylosporangium sp. NBC_01737]|uniref:serine/threonine-protein kinase n=1 Tax=Dactylosporangium sp. NBC_01737 TaxID=2975959 RepID=UPI002E0FB997|nr:serine/threonine protein kinase [Dactylosporangium sp. NBC_01737]
MTGLSVFARGGYATVYRATQESVGREVAVKVENRTLETDRDRRRFLREARAAGRMSSHPHVVDLFDAGVTELGHPYLIMELCDGSYAERMKDSPLTAIEARDVGFKIADALADAHALGVLHRDVKPANILFSRFGEPALADFGLAILAEWRDESMTLDTLTPAYAPPETFRQSPPAAAADVYALCATLYALMRGRPPRWRDDQAPSLLSLVDMFNEQIPDLPGCPESLMAVLRAGMANEEAARPSAIELRDLLIGLRLEPSPRVTVPPLGSPPVEPVYTSKAPPTPPPPPDRLLESPFMVGEDPDRTVQHAAEAPWLGGGPPPVGPPDGVVLDTPTPPPGARRFVLIVGAVLLLVMALAGAGIAYNLSGGPGPGPTKSPGPTGSSTPSPTRTAGAVACPPGTSKAARCSQTVECFDADLKAVGCAAAHTWEVFAYGDLAKGSQVKTAKDSPVDEVCSFTTLLLVDLRAVNWKVDVILPTLSEQQAGPTVFRCLAGNPPKTVTGQQLRRQ